MELAILHLHLETVPWSIQWRQQWQLSLQKLQESPLAASCWWLQSRAGYIKRRDSRWYQLIKPGGNVTGVFQQRQALHRWPRLIGRSPRQWNETTSNFSETLGLSRRKIGEGRKWVLSPPAVFRDYWKKGLIWSLKIGNSFTYTE